ncbi:MAG: helix-turn-helix transcriptional regulator [Nitrospiraceae bacterium]
MSIGHNISAWRNHRKVSTETFAARLSYTVEQVDQLERGLTNPTVAELETIAAVLDLSPAWLYGSPQDVTILARCADEEDDTDSIGRAPIASLEAIDPIIERMVRSIGPNRRLYTLVTTLVRSGDERLLRAAEVSLNSLVKQVKPVSFPWASRQPGHFEPPSD